MSNIDKSVSAAINELLEISIQDIGYSINIPHKKSSFARTEYESKQILNGITGTFKSGRLTAVMGA
jgi:ABC-type multidrug transport system ATPase subunit